MKRRITGGTGTQENKNKKCYNNKPKPTTKNNNNPTTTRDVPRSLADVIENETVSSIAPSSSSTNDECDEENVDTQHPTSLLPDLCHQFSSGNYYSYDNDDETAELMKNRTRNTSNTNNKKRFFSERACLLLFVQLALALEYLHRHNILHRHLSPGNILLSKKWILKLWNFDFAKQFDQDISAPHPSVNSGVAVAGGGVSSAERTGQQCDEDRNIFEKNNNDDPNVSTTTIGSSSHMPPEVLQHVAYSQKADVFSLGVLLYQIITLQSPPSVTKQFLKKVVVDDEKDEEEGEQEEDKKNFEYDFPPIHSYRPDVSTELNNLVNNLLQANPRKRMTANEILHLPFVQNAVIEYIVLVERMVLKKKSNIKKDKKNINPTDQAWVAVLKDHARVLYGDEEFERKFDDDERSAVAVNPTTSSSMANQNQNQQPHQQTDNTSDNKNNTTNNFSMSVVSSSFTPTSGMMMNNQKKKKNVEEEKCSHRHNSKKDVVDENDDDVLGGTTTTMSKISEGVSVRSAAVKKSKVLQQQHQRHQEQPQEQEHKRDRRNTTTTNATSTSEGCCYTTTVGTRSLGASSCYGEDQQQNNNINDDDEADDDDHNDVEETNSKNDNTQNNQIRQTKNDRYIINKPEQQQQRSSMTKSTQLLRRQRSFQVQRKMTNLRQVEAQRQNEQKVLNELMM